VSDDMPIGTRPPAEVTIDRPLVRALLQEQHADLAQVPLTRIGEGWDNALFRLGDDLIVRLPRRALSATLIEHEQRWLPILSPRLPLPVPVPLRVGRPGHAFPWAWSIAAWLPGETALAAPPQDVAGAAVDLARFLRALHQPAPAEAPHNPWRGIPLAARTHALMSHLEQLDGLIDRTAALRLWDDALSAAPRHGPPVWIHGDLHPGNLLVCHGRLSAVIDFGDLTAGDPATDLSVLWMLPAPVRSTGFAAARSELGDLDEDAWTRARGWALALGLAFLANSRGDEPMAALGRRTVTAALDEVT